MQAVGERAQLGECVPHKQKVLISDPQHPRKLGWLWFCAFITPAFREVNDREGQSQADPWNSFNNLPSQVNDPQVP